VAHLAPSFAEIGKKVLLIDADLRRPTTHTHFQLENGRGLSDVLAGRIPFREAIVQIEHNLYLLPAGPVCPGSSDLIGSRISGLLEEAYREFEMVIVDSPALVACPESQQIAAFADGTVVVVKARSTTSKELARTLSALSRARANIMGLALNQVKSSDGITYGYYPSSYVDYARRGTA
jgi:capsular exopolysaccharide synthesis family protein